MFGFIVITYCESDYHIKTLRECISSIRKYHKNEIVIIDDGSPLETNLFGDIADIKWYKSEVKGYELSPYYMYLKYKYFDKAIILHDSMHLKEEIKMDDSDIKIIWSISENRQLTKTYLNVNLIEPQTNYNRDFNIKTDKDLMVHLVSNLEDSYFKEQFENFMNQSNSWLGCFGLMTMIKHEFLEKMENETHILSVIPHIKNRRDRQALERIFGIVIKYMYDYKILRDIVYDVDVSFTNMMTGLQFYDDGFSNKFSKEIFLRG